MISSLGSELTKLFLARNTDLPARMSSLT
uniref:Uncharacterized protein n=1 Tax=Anguilla anguilla TaxID=7936 RepID=A0A0E9SQC2_ANGAN